MSNYGQQPPYGQNPYGPPGAQQPPNPYGQPQQPYGSQQRPGQPPYGAPQQTPYGQQPYQGQQPPYGQPGQPPPGSAQSAPAYGQPGQWTPQPPAAKKPAMAMPTLPVVSMETVPGREISKVVGPVIGVVARTRELRADLRGGNPIEGYNTMLTESRQEAVARMVEMAEAAGANGVVGLRFDCSEITQSLSEVAAYGTAVRFVGAPEPEAEETASVESDAPSLGGSSQWPPSSS